MLNNTFISGNTVDVSLVDASGRALDLYYYKGRYYVEAKHGQEYRINVQNLTGKRIEVLTAIDGRSTTANLPASFSMRGMVISAYSLYDVKGWRLNDRQTKPFEFTAFDEETVAAQATGSNKDLGVISVAVFREYERPVQRIENFGTMRGAVSKGGLESFSEESQSFSLGVGTGMGDRVDRDLVGHTTFDRASSSPVDVLSIYAMPTWWFISQGINLVRPTSGGPNPWPGNDDTGYGNFRTTK